MFLRACVSVRGQLYGLGSSTLVWVPGAGLFGKDFYPQAPDLELLVLLFPPSKYNPRMAGCTLWLVYAELGVESWVSHAR